MSTSTTPTPTPATGAAATTPIVPTVPGGAFSIVADDPRPSRGAGIAIGIGACLAIVGAVTALAVALGGPGSTVDPAPAPAPVATHATGYVPAPHDIAPAVHPVTPVAPSAAIESLQRELGALDYYEGPVTGVMNQQTTQAITYLQRDAHLPETGTMNAQTQAALASFLAHGNNQMGR